MCVPVAATGRDGGRLLRATAGLWGPGLSCTIMLTKVYQPIGSTDLSVHVAHVTLSAAL